MLNKKVSLWTVFFAIMSVLSICFIFSNSLKNPSASNQQSENVAESLRQILNPAKQVEQEAFYIYIRKLAHFVEFSVLGFCLKGTAVTLGYRRNYPYTLFPLLIAIFVAVMDESIQSFTGRTSSVKDVFIDSLGGLFGILLMFTMSVFIEKTKSKLRK